MKLLTQAIKKARKEIRKMRALGIIDGPRDHTTTYVFGRSAATVYLETGSLAKARKVPGQIEVMKFKTAGEKAAYEAALSHLEGWSQVTWKIEN